MWHHNYGILRISVDHDALNDDRCNIFVNLSMFCYINYWIIIYDEPVIYLVAMGPCVRFLFVFYLLSNCKH